MDEKKVKDLTAYNERFNEDPTSFNDFQASDYVKELKNQGKEDQAIEVGRTFLEQCPELSGYINYYGYALYNRYINIDDEKIAENEKLFYDILAEIASHCRQERYSPLEAAINKAIKYESKKNPVDYKKLSDLLDNLDAPTLEDTPFVNKEGKEFESKKEKWYRMKVRALYEIGNYSECLKQAQIATGLPLKWHYNNLNWVQYYKASALVKLGRYEEAENIFIALKDNAGLVKKYAMVNVQKYQVVGIGDTVSECEEEYYNLLLKEGIQKEAEDTRKVQTLTGKISKIAQGVVDGNSHYYMMLEGSDEIFDISVADMIQVIKYEIGQEITLEYKAGEEVNTVLSIQ